MGKFCAGENKQAGKIVELHSEQRGDRAALRAAVPTQRGSPKNAPDPPLAQREVA